MGFSQGLLAGYNVGSGILDRQDRLKQQVVDNDVRERNLAILEATEGRTQQRHEFSNNLDALEGDFTELATDTDLNQFATNVQQKGKTAAIIEVAKQTPTKDLDGVFKGKNSSTAASTIIKGSSKLQQAIDPTGNWKFNGIFPVTTGEKAGQYVLALQDENGEQSMLTEDRGSNEGAPKTFSTEHLAMFMADSLREEGALADPKNVQMLEEAGIDVAGTNAMLDGDNPIDGIPKRASLENIKRISIDGVKKPKGKQLNDGTKVPVSRAQSPLGEEPLGAGFQENLRAFGQKVKNEGNAAREEAIANDNAFIGGITDSITEGVSDATDSVLGGFAPVTDFVQNDLARTGNVINRAVEGDRGVFTEFGEEFDSELAATGDALTRPARVAIGAGKAVKEFLFGKSKAEDKKVVEGIASTDPVKVEEAQDKISEDIKTKSPEQRTQLGANDVKEASKLISTSTTNRTPTAKQQAIATRLLYNGLLSSRAHETYLQTGRFSYADVAAAASENNSRQAAIRNQIAVRKLQGTLNKDQIALMKEGFDSVKASASDSLTQVLSTAPNWVNLAGQDGSTVDLANVSSNLIDTVAGNRGIQRALGIKNQFEFNDTHAEMFVRYMNGDSGRRGGKQLLQSGEKNTFSADKEGNPLYSAEAMRGFKTWLSQQK